MPKLSSKTFTRVGPGGGGGQIRPSIHPTKPNVLFVVCDMTGWLQTTNAGKSWRQINLKGVVRACAFDEHDRNRIYAGNSGLYRSADLGKTWRLVFPNPAKVIREVEACDHAGHRYESRDNWPGGTILGIAVDPADSKRIHLAIYRGADQGELLIFSSSDFGKSFLQTARVSPVDPNEAMGDNHAVKLFCVDADSPKTSRDLYLATLSGLYRIAVNSGEVKWLPPPDGTGCIVQADWGRDAGAKKPVFYITTPTRWKDAATLIGGVYRTAADGADMKWQQVNTGMLEGLHKPGIAQPPQFICVAVSRIKPDIAYVECCNHREKSDEDAVWGHPYGVFKTTDGGKNWRWCFRTSWDERALNTTRECWLTRWVSPGSVGAAIHVAVAPSDPDVVWRVTAMCSQKSEDGGKTWQETYNNWLPDGSATTNGMDVTTCYGVHFDPHVKDRIFITYTDISLWRSDTGGKGWWLAKGGVPNSWRNTCYWMEFDPDVRDRMWSVWSGCHDLPRPKMFGGGWERRMGGVAFSGDGGKSWHPWTTGMPDNSVPTHIILDPKSPVGSRTLYVAAFNQGVYRSENDGRSWQIKNNGIDPSNHNAWRVVIGPDSAVYAVFARGGREDAEEIDGAVYRSVERGDSWHKLALPPGVNAPNDLSIDPRDGKRLYLACWPRTVKGEPVSGGVWGSRDGGKTWNNLLDQRLHCYAVTIDPAKPDRLFVCGFNNSIFRSDDGGRRWRRLGGYNFKWGHRVMIDPHHRDMIYVTSFGGSVFYGPAGGTGAKFEDIVRDEGKGK